MSCIPVLTGVPVRVPMGGMKSPGCTWQSRAANLPNATAPTTPGMLRRSAGLKLTTLNDGAVRVCWLHANPDTSGSGKTVRLPPGPRLKSTGPWGRRLDLIADLLEDGGDALRREHGSDGDLLFRNTGLPCHADRVEEGILVRTAHGLAEAPERLLGRHGCARGGAYSSRHD